MEKYCIISHIILLKNCILKSTKSKKEESLTSLDYKQHLRYNPIPNNPIRIRVDTVTQDRKNLSIVLYL